MWELSGGKKTHTHTHTPPPPPPVPSLSFASFNSSNFCWLVALLESSCTNCADCKKTAWRKRALASSRALQSGTRRLMEQGHKDDGWHILLYSPVVQTAEMQRDGRVEFVKGGRIRRKGWGRRVREVERLGEKTDGESHTHTLSLFFLSLPLSYLQAMRGGPILAPSGLHSFPTRPSKEACLWSWSGLLHTYLCCVSEDQS